MIYEFGLFYQKVVQSICEEYMRGKAKMEQKEEKKENIKKEA